MSRCRVETSRPCASPAPTWTAFRGVAAWVSLTRTSWSASVPDRRPPSRSLANGGPPPFIQSGGPGPAPAGRLRVLPPRGEEAGVADLERLAHPPGDLACRGLEAGVGMLADEQDPGEVAEVRVPQPREPVEPEPAHDRALPILDQ